MVDPSAVVFGLVLGFSLTIPPGPMNALITSAAVRSWRSGVVTGLGALSADAVLGVAVFELQSVVDFSRYIGWIYLLGTVAMIGLALLLLRSKPAGVAGGDRHLATYSRAVLLGITNPFQIVWWFTAGIAFAYVGGALLFAGLFGAIAIWVIVFPGMVHTGTQRYPQLAAWLSIGSALLLLAFSAYFLALAAVSLT
ncbi:MAG: LysE family transporter [Thermoplasmata archaeon]